MHYGFDEEEGAFRAEVARWAEKVLAPHYQSDDKAAEFRRQQAADMAQMGLTGLRITPRRFKPSELFAPGEDKYEGVTLLAVEV